jgi:hypothetical protein
MWTSSTTSRQLGCSRSTVSVAAPRTRRASKSTLVDRGWRLGACDYIVVIYVPQEHIYMYVCVVCVCTSMRVFGPVASGFDRIDRSIDPSQCRRKEIGYYYSPRGPSRCGGRQLHPSWRRWRGRAWPWRVGRAGAVETLLDGCFLGSTLLRCCGVLGRRARRASCALSRLLASRPHRVVGVMWGVCVSSRNRLGRVCFRGVMSGPIADPAVFWRCPMRCVLVRALVVAARFGARSAPGARGRTKHPPPRDAKSRSRP